MGANNLLSKLDDAIVAYLVAEGAGYPDDSGAATVYPAKISSNKSVPCTIVHSSRAEPELQYSGRYVVTTMVMIKYAGPEEYNQTEGAAKEASDLRVSTTFDLLIPGGNTHQDSDQIANAINAAAAAAGLTVTVFGIMVDSIELDFAEDVWVDTLTLRIVASPSTIN